MNMGPRRREQRRPRLYSACFLPAGFFGGGGSGFMFEPPVLAFLEDRTVRWCAALKAGLVMKSIGKVHPSTYMPLIGS